jgi:hypothetical protein
LFGDPDSSENQYRIIAATDLWTGKVDNAEEVEGPCGIICGM